MGCWARRNSKFWLPAAFSRRQASVEVFFFYTVTSVQFCVATIQIANNLWSFVVHKSTIVVSATLWLPFLIVIQIEVSFCVLSSDTDDRFWRDFLLCFGLSVELYLTQGHYSIIRTSTPPPPNAGESHKSSLSPTSETCRHSMATIMHLIMQFDLITPCKNGKALCRANSLLPHVTPP